MDSLVDKNLLASVLDAQHCDHAVHEALCRARARGPNPAVGVGMSLTSSTHGSHAVPEWDHVLLQKIAADLLFLLPLPPDPSYMLLVAAFGL